MTVGDLLILTLVVGFATYTLISPIALYLLVFVSHTHIESVWVACSFAGSVMFLGFVYCIARGMIVSLLDTKIGDLIVVD